MEEIPLGDFFTNKEYDIQTFEYKGIKEDIKCLKSCATDYDLTGQIIWEAAIQLAQLIIDNQDEFKNKIVIELGAGAGLTGIVCANFAKKVILTDNNEIVVDLLQQNQQIQQKKNLEVEQFQWGESEAKDLISKYNEIDYLIGSDILHWPASIKPLAETCKVYFDFFPKIKILIALQERSKYTIDNFDIELERLNLKKSLVQKNGLVFIYKIENKQLK